ncbi:hypothetical protein [Flagellimonas halotolerans]
MNAVKGYMKHEKQLLIE